MNQTDPTEELKKRIAELEIFAKYVAETIDPSDFPICRRMAKKLLEPKEDKQ